MKTSHIAVVSAFGRGHGIAVKLRELEMDVALIDVSGQLGESSPEDEEGPLGVFFSGLAAADEERIQQEGVIVPQEDGWTTVLASGPVEMRSSFLSHRLEKLGVPLESLEALREAREGRFKSVAKWVAADLEKSWLLEVAASLGSNTVQFHPESLMSGTFLPLDEEFHVRMVTPSGLKKSLMWCEQKGVQVLNDGILLDVAREGKALNGLQYRPKNSQTTKILNFEQIIWCLSGEETGFLSTSIQEKLFREGILRPSWVWSRSRIRIPAGPEAQVLPVHSVWIADLDLSWTHENLFILQKCATPEFYDVWIRVPAEQRAQRVYMQERMNRVVEVLAQRLVTVKPTKAEDAGSAEKTYREIGPPRQPLFDPKALLTWRVPNEDNLHLHTPEVWNGLGWNSLFKHEEKIRTRTQAWWKKREEQRRAREERTNKT